MGSLSVISLCQNTFKNRPCFFWQSQDTKVFGHFLPQMVGPCWEVLWWKLVNFQKYGNVPFIHSSSMI